MFRWAITFSCHPSYSATFGSNAPTALQAFRGVKRLARALPQIRDCYMVEIEDSWQDRRRRFGKPSDRFDFWTVPDPYYPTRRKAS